MDKSEEGCDAPCGQAGGLALPAQLATGSTVCVEGLTVRRGAAEVLRDVSFECHEGEWTLITGPSGAGKSTLLAAINGLCTPSRGRIWTMGTLVPGRSRREARQVWRRTGTVLQGATLFETRSALRNVELGLRAAGYERRTAREIAVEWLTRLGLGHKLQEPPWRLSGGESQRVCLARALAPRPRLVVLDEPTSALDGDTARIVLAAVQELVDAGSTVVMSSHRDYEVLDLCDQHLRVDGGQITTIQCRAGRLVAPVASSPLEERQDSDRAGAPRGAPVR